MEAVPIPGVPYPRGARGWWWGWGGPGCHPRTRCWWRRTRAGSHGDGGDHVIRRTTRRHPRSRRDRKLRTRTPSLRDGRAARLWTRRTWLLWQRVMVSGVPGGSCSYPRAVSSDVGRVIPSRITSAPLSWCDVTALSHYLWHSPSLSTSYSTITLYLTLSFNIHELQHSYTISDTHSPRTGAILDNVHNECW